jgi:hypothetical protein
MKVRRRSEWHRFAASEPFRSPAGCVREIGLLLGHLQRKIGVSEQRPKALLDKIRAAVKVGDGAAGLELERIGLQQYVHHVTTPDTAAEVEGFASKWRRRFPSRRLTLTEWQQEFEAWQLLQVITPMIVEALNSSHDKAVTLESAITLLLAIWAEERLQGS